MVEPSLELLQTLMLRSLDGQADIRRELKDIRRELGDVRDVTLLLAEKVERLDRSVQETKRDMHDIRDDIWTMLKAELMGRQGHFETRIEALIEQRIEAHLAAMTERPLPD